MAFIVLVVLCTTHMHICICIDTMCSISGFGYWTLKYVLQMALKVEVVVNCN